MPAHLLYGDSFLVADAFKRLQEQVGPEDVLAANSHRINGGQIDPAQLKGLCSAVPFLAEYRLVAVEGLLAAQAGGQSRGNRRRGSRSSGSGQGQWENLPQYIGEEMPPTTMLVFLEGAISNRDPLMAKLSPVVQVQPLPTPTGEGLARWARDRVAEKGARISPGAIRLLTQLVGGNLWTMDNELEKLALYAGDRSIEDGDVRRLVSQAREANVFSAVDSLLEGRSSAAFGMMDRLREDGAEFPYIVAMIARQLRLVTLARDMIDGGMKDREIGERLNLTRDFMLRKTLEQARKHSWANLTWFYERLMEADLAVKQGRLGQDLALELLVSESSALSSSSGGGRRGGGGRR